MILCVLCGLFSPFALFYLRATLPVMKRARPHSSRPSFGKSLVAGLAGALAVNAMHEFTRKSKGGNPSTADAPRLDRLGQDSLAMGMRRIGVEPPAAGPKRYWSAMAGDVAMNALLYAVTTSRKSALAGGGASGLLAGVSGLLLPRLIGMNRYAGTTKKSRAMTFADYAVGGLVTGAVMKVLNRRK